MTRPARALERLALAFLLLPAACGKYGPPVRAGEGNAERTPPRLDVPLPAPFQPSPAPAAPAAPSTPAEPPEPAPEVEPPPEGAP